MQCNDLREVAGTSPSWFLEEEDSYTGPQGTGRYKQAREKKEDSSTHRPRLVALLDEGTKQQRKQTCSETHTPRAARPPAARRHKAPGLAENPRKI